MFCDQCGNVLATGQQYCSGCGKAVVGGVPQFRGNRVQEHVRMLAILWMAYSALNVVGGVLMIVVAHTLFGGMGGPPPQITIWLRPLITAVGALVLVKAAAGFFAGWGLLQRESWARILALIVGFIALLNIPLGTALGIYTLWVLLPAKSDQEYQILAQRQPA